MSFSLVTKHSRFPHLADTIIPDEGSGKSKSLGMMVAAAAANFIKQEDVTRTNIVGLFTATDSSDDDQTGESLTYQVRKEKHLQKKKNNNINNIAISFFFHHQEFFFFCREGIGISIY